MIRVLHLHKSFNGTEVLRGVEFEVRDRETLVIIGTSGGGKSVLLKHLCGLLKPEAGQVLVDDIDIVPLSEKDLAPVRKKFGVLFQGAALFDSMTLYDNVAFPLVEEHRYTAAEIETLVLHALQIVDLEKARDRKPSELSGGMRKRAGLARACVASPKYVLYDEQTTGLDPIRADSINRLILRLRDELHVTGVAVTHDMNSAYTIADRVAMLHDGRIHFVGTPREVQDSTDPLLQDFINGRSHPRKELAHAAPPIH